MQRFDCLSPECSLQGPHLLEASAGTGKTFAVEHIFVRLLLEASLEIEDILVITFTRAATRELKERIRSNLQKAVLQLQENSVQWDYLKPFAAKKEAAQKLQDALSAFDLSQIFTIHGFCHRMLKEFAFEAHLSFSTKDLGEPRMQVPAKLRAGVLDFLTHLPPDLLCPEQLGALYKKYQSAEKLVGKLLTASADGSENKASFEELYQTYARSLERWNLRNEELQEDFALLRKNYRAQVKGQFERQIEVLSGPITKEGFRFLLAEEGSVFSFLSSENRKVRFAPISTKSDDFFAWGLAHLTPLIERALDPKNLFELLAEKWSAAAERLMLKEDVCNPDAILKKMHATLSERPDFFKAVKGKYRAAIIDEFQDTDRLQWDIFQKLFLAEKSRTESVFLVGDPKQSIYRFRKADIYTYLAAKEFLAPSCHYCLDTNFRSTPALIDALNVLFQRPWLSLPKLGSFLPYHPVRAGARDVQGFSDGKGALHIFAARIDALARPEALFLSFIAQEIFRLKKEGLSLSRFAVLVKDRYQAERLVDFLEEKGIACLTKSHMPLGETFGFKTLYELLRALLDPQDRSRMKFVLAGPLARFKIDEIPLEIPPLFFELKAALEAKGLAFFFQRLFSSKFSEKNVLESIALQDASFYRDFFHGVELLLDWERTEGFSLEGLDRRLKEILQQDPEDDERVRRKFANDDEAVQVMTMHVSKGLEFDVVFALGLVASTPKPSEKEESEAEKMRQLYVAMTRAKRRLYVPAILEEGPLDEEGKASPMQLFLHRLQEGRPLEAVFDELKEKASITWEILQTPCDLPPSLELERLSLPVFVETAKIERFSFLHSFTSLASNRKVEPLALIQEEVISIHTFPRGAETGILLHEILEDLFSSPYPAWRDESRVNEIVFQKIKDSRYAPWLEVLQQLIGQVVNLPFLAELEPEDVRVEMEFIFEKNPHFIKGFVDLIFRVRGQLYLVDWKSNWLGSGDEAYSYEALEQAMKEHDYEFQASLYAEALKRCFPKFEFGGAYYIFLRGMNSLTQGIFFFQPEISS